MKKKSVFRFVNLSLVLLLMTALIFAAGCGSKEPAETKAPAETTTAPEAKGPVKGGTLRILNNGGPQVLGYNPKMGPLDSSGVFAGVETIMVNTKDRKFVPFLAKSVVEDPDKLTMTITLNEGIKFHDGTELTAEVAAWNYKINLDAKKLQFSDKVKKVEVVDKYTLVLHLTEWHNQMIQAYGYIPMYSKEAFEKNGQEWALTHPVSTGPFKLEEFKRDVSATWVKNEDYWRDGLPYLDRVEYKFVTDPTTAAAMLQAGEVDVWLNTPQRDQAEMEKKGFVRQAGWTGLPWFLIPNTMKPNSIWNDKKLREALEYALDKEAIAKSLGFGYRQAIYNVAPPAEWGGNLAPLRKYDPAKAKQLLADAGYPKGLKVKLLAVMGAGGRNEDAEAIKGYLDAAGFQTEIDIADPGRFYGTVFGFGAGWDDLALMFSGLDVNYLVSANRWWGPTPITNLAGLKRSQPFADLFKAANSVKTEAEQQANVEKIVKYMTEEEVSVIPVYHAPTAAIMKPGIHFDYPAAGLTRWDLGEAWMEQK